MNNDAIKAAATTVRALSMDGIQKANSGHPGLPMGCADLGALLYGEILKHNPADPGWMNRDRFVLSAGHGSMFLYSLLHLCGYGLTIDDLKNFRQIGSLTPGHPEYGHTKGVEITTGPLGAGISNVVGMAIAQEMNAARYNTADHKVIDHYIYSLAGDGCMMEGVSAEASSLAGHLGLGKLIVFYDSNSITIEGSTDLAFTEDVAARYAAYGWQVLEGDGHNIEEIAGLVEKAKAETSKPTLIKLTTIIGKGAATKEGTHKVHGAPLGEDEIKATRKKLGIPEDQDFYVAPEAVAYFDGKKAEWKSAYDEWQKMFADWSAANPVLKKEWDSSFAEIVDLSKVSFPEFKVGDSMATRAASGKVLNAIADGVPNLVGGSADLAPSNNTAMPAYGDFSLKTPKGRTLHFGVREHAMGGILNGMTAYGGLRTFGGTFLVFADYLRPTVRLSALMNLPITYVLTHDSIYVGEDGPTHQPIETISSLRIIPNTRVLRPADAQETEEAWIMAMERTGGPSVLCLTRQNLDVFEKPADWKASIRKGAYIAKDCDGTPEVVIAATGSEVNLALNAAGLSSKEVRVVSIISRELFLQQDKAYQESLIPGGVRTIVVEVGVTSGWEGIASSPEDCLCLNRFGESGPAGEVAAKFGFTSENLAKLIG